MDNRSTIGISEYLPGANMLIQGSFHGSLVLIGPPGSGKSVYCKQFIGHAVENGNTGIYITTENSIPKVEEGLALLGFNVEKLVHGGGLRLLDLRPSHNDNEKLGEKQQIGIRSWLKGPSSDKKKNPFMETLQRIDTSVTGFHRPILVVDTLTGLLSYHNEEDFLEFLRNLLDQLKTKNAMSLFSLTLGGQSEKFTTMVRSLFDGVLEMKTDESAGSMRPLLRVFSLKGTSHKTDWLGFNMSNEGLIVEESKDQMRCALCSRQLGTNPIKYDSSGQTVYFDSKECLTNYRKLKSVYGETFL